MRYEDAIALLISANNARNIAMSTLRRAEKDISRATEILCAEGPDELKPGKTITFEGYAVTRGRRKGRRYVDNPSLLDAWEDLPKRVRDRFDTTFQGTVADLEELMGSEEAVPYLKLSVGSETILVKEVLEPTVEKAERVDFRG